MNERNCQADWSNEIHMKQLALFTSELMERRFNEDCDEKNIKVEILNKSQYCEGRRKILMKHVKEGSLT